MPPASVGKDAALQKMPTVPVIGAGDLLKVSVLGAPDSDQEVRVDAKGNIFLNFIGAVAVAGQTTEQAQAEIAKKYVAGGFFTNPQVSVFAKEYVTQGVSVLGEVQRPGVYPVLGARSLFDVLSLAGGTTPKAGKLISITHRETPQSPTTVSLSNDSAESVRSNVDIYPGDTIMVSKAGMVYVVGDVHRPSGGGDGQRQHDRAAGHRDGRRGQSDRSPEQCPAYSHHVEGTGGDSVAP